MGQAKVRFFPATSDKCLELGFIEGGIKSVFAKRSATIKSG